MSTVRISLGRTGSTTAAVVGGPLGQVVVAIGRLLATAARWMEVARQRRELEGLSDHGLKDLGLSRADVDGELRKPFWR